MLGLAGRHEDIEVSRIGCDAFDRSFPAPELAANHPRNRAVIVSDLGNVAGGDVLIARRGHLERGRQVGPELEAMHAALAVALRHLLMEDAAARRHPLHITSAEAAAIAEAVTVIDRAS